MAKTSFATSNALTKKAWEEKLFRDLKKESYFEKWTGEGADSIIQEKRQLQKGKGDLVNFGIRMRLSGAGVTSGQILEGNEEKLSTYSDDVTLEQYRHAVRDQGELDRQRAMFSIDDESEQAIKDWGAEKIDKLRFDALDAAREKVFYTTSALTFDVPGTAKAAITVANSKLTLAMLSKIKAWMKTGGARTYVPMRPVKVKGKEYFIALCHPDVLYDLKVTDTNWATAQRDAQTRGDDNPIFTGAAGIWDGIVLHEHENCYIAADAGPTSNVPWSKVNILGAQSLIQAWSKAPKVTQETFDYGNEHGYAIDMLTGVTRPLFNSLTYGSVGLYVSRTNISGL